MPGEIPLEISVDENGAVRSIGRVGAAIRRQMQQQQELSTPVGRARLALAGAQGGAVAGGTLSPEGAAALGRGVAGVAGPTARGRAFAAAIIGLGRLSDPFMTSQQRGLQAAEIGVRLGVGALGGGESAQEIAVAAERRAEGVQERQFIHDQAFADLKGIGRTLGRMGGLTEFGEQNMDALRDIFVQRASRELKGIQGAVESMDRKGLVGP